MRWYILRQGRIHPGRGANDHRADARLLEHVGIAEHIAATEFVAERVQ